MNSLDTYLTTINRQRLNKIKKKKSSNKGSNIFSCLTNEVVEIKSQPVVRELLIEKTKKDKKQSKIERSKSRFKFLLKQVEKGKELNNKRTRRYIRLALELNEPIPDNIKDDYLKLLESKKPKKIKKPKKQRSRKYINRKPTKYETYINSSLWEKRRNAFYKEFGRTCKICGQVNFIHLHHMYYGEYGEEKNEDLVALCRDHHEQFHKELGKTKKDMRKETLLFIERLAII